MACYTYFFLKMAVDIFTLTQEQFRCIEQSYYGFYFFLILLPTCEIFVELTQNLSFFLVNLFFFSFSFASSLCFLILHCILQGGAASVVSHPAECWIFCEQKQKIKILQLNQITQAKWTIAFSFGTYISETRKKNNLEFLFNSMCYNSNTIKVSA